MATTPPYKIHFVHCNWRTCIQIYVISGTHLLLQH